MPGQLVWGWYPEGNKWVKLRVDEDGSFHVVGYIDKLNDIGDVNVPAPGDDEVLYWDAAGPKWQSKAIWVAAHKATHENDGADEISIAGLAGEPAELTTHKGLPSIHHSNVADLTFIIDGGGSAITTGEKGHLEIPFACTIIGWTILADRSGSIEVDVWKDTYAAFPPAVGDTIAGSEKPTISGAQKGQDLTLTTWTTAIAAGDILAFNVDSVTDIQRVTISLKVEKS